MNIHRDFFAHSSSGCRIHTHAFEIAARLQVVVQLCDQFRVVRGTRLERHHALQQVLVQRCVATEGDGAQAITRATLVDQFDIRHTGLRIDGQALATEAPTEEAIARRLVLDQPLGILVMAVIELFTRPQRLAVRHAEGLHLAGWALDAHGHVAQANRFARVDADDQLWGMVCVAGGLDLGIDLRLIVAKCLRRFARLLLCPATEAQKCFFVAVTQCAYIAFDIGLERLVGRLHLHQQLALAPCCETGDPENQAPGQSS
ncbi:hypothetical protein D3C80_1359040 [compost metagenome]